MEEKGRFEGALKEAEDFSRREQYPGPRLSHY